MKKSILILVLAVCLLSDVNAQNVERRWNIGLHGGIAQYNGDIGMGFYDFDQAYYGFGGVSISAALSNHWDLNILGTFGEVGFREDENTKFRAKMNTVTFNLRYNILGLGWAIRPYLYAGVGIVNHPKKYTVPEVKNNIALPSAGIGFNFPLG